MNRAPGSIMAGNGRAAVSKKGRSPKRLPMLLAPAGRTPHQDAKHPHVRRLVDGSTGKRLWRLGGVEARDAAARVRVLPQTELAGEKQKNK